MNNLTDPGAEENGSQPFDAARGSAARRIRKERWLVTVAMWIGIMVMDIDARNFEAAWNAFAASYFCCVIWLHDRAQQNDQAHRLER